MYGKAFEHFITLELRAYLSYRRKHLTLSYWQALNGQEVDFIIGDAIAIEVKATSHVQNKHLKSLKSLAEEKICKNYFLVSQDNMQRRIDNFHILPWQDFLKKLWADEIV